MLLLAPINDYYYINRTWNIHPDLIKEFHPFQLIKWRLHPIKNVDGREIPWNIPSTDYTELSNHFTAVLYYSPR